MSTSFNSPALLFQTTDLLGIGASYISPVLKIENWQQVQTNVISDTDGTIQIDFVRDSAGTDVLRSLTIPYKVGDGYQMFSAPAFTPYVIYKFTNDSLTFAQTDFYFDTKGLKSGLSPQVLGVYSYISPKMVSSLNRSVLVGKNVKGHFQNLTTNEVAGNRSLFGELITTERTPLIELNSALGLSVLRDKITEVADGTVDNTGGEYVLSTGTTTASSAELNSVEYGRYYPGTAAQAGMGVRLEFGDTYTGTAKAEWGYFSAADGFGFGVDAGGTYIFYTRAGSQSKVYQVGWNIDVMNGSGPSGVNLDLTVGNIYQISFSWYGYGVIEWYIVTDGITLDAPGGAPDINQFTEKQAPVLVHRYRPQYGNSVQNPNQPISVKVDNGDTTTDYKLYVGGRHYSIYGRYIPSFRRTQESIIGVTNVTSAAFKPIISFKRKAGKEGFPVKFHEVSIISDQNIIWELRVSPTLTTPAPAWGNISNIPTTETALEVDVAATVITGGQKLESGLVSTSGVGSTQSGGASNDSFAIEIPGTEIVTLCVIAVGTTATVTAILGMEEEW